MPSNRTKQDDRHAARPERERHLIADREVVHLDERAVTYSIDVGGEGPVRGELLQQRECSSTLAGTRRVVADLHHLGPYEPQAVPEAQEAVLDRAVLRELCLNLGDLEQLAQAVAVELRRRRLILRRRAVAGGSAAGWLCAGCPSAPAGSVSAPHPAATRTATPQQGGPPALARTESPRE